MSNVREYKKNIVGNVKLSDNFKINEFACKDGTNKILIDLDLIPIIQYYRNYINSPVIINSAYRTVNYNKKIGGSKNSFHLYGRALDIQFNKNNKIKKVKEMSNIFYTLGIKGIICYEWGCHIDTRNTIYRAYNNGLPLNNETIKIPFEKNIKYLDNNILVGIIQFKLNSLGYNCGNCDMKFGPNTLNAIKKYQNNKNLIVDGIIGKKTWDKLF